MKNGNDPENYYNMPQAVPPSASTEEERERLLNISYDRSLKKGRKHAVIVSVVMILFTAPELLFSIMGIRGLYTPKDILLWMAMTALPIAFIFSGVCFIRGGNWCRIFFGVVSCLIGLGAIALTAFAGHFVWEALSDTGFTFPAKLFIMAAGLAMEFSPFAALCGYMFWTAFISKDVKAYCAARN